MLTNESAGSTDGAVARCGRDARAPRGSVGQARADIADYMDWYNKRRPHSSLDRITPEEKYFGLLPSVPKAA